MSVDFPPLPVARYQPVPNSIEVLPSRIHHVEAQIRVYRFENGQVFDNLYNRPRSLAECERLATLHREDGARKSLQDLLDAMQKWAEHRAFIEAT